ncbi:hypothetical protein [Dactylosporangium sp. CA-092794]|uniref:hypothetical protein n=1 Tax=Dactylosporangium sp. CA-092794 TaxID=3239929 RepID=UPI003D904847
MARNTQPHYAGARPPWTQPGFLVAAALIGLVVLAGVVVVAAPRNGSAGDVAAQSATLQETPSTSGRQSNAQPPAAQPTAVLTSAPPDVTWQLVGQVALPVSPSAGPFQVTATTATGYAHTPTGSLVAAAQIATRAMSVGGRDVWEPTILRQFMPGADRDQLLAGLRAAPSKQAEPGATAQISGFQFYSYGPDTAVVGLAIQSAGQGAIVTMTLQWRDEDWRMVAPPGGSWASVAKSTDGVAGIVPWGAR